MSSPISLGTPVARERPFVSAPRRAAGRVAPTRGAADLDAAGPSPSIAVG
ncbi:hypothetical protein [Pseudactinotalea sp. HY160]|nr:hypothetical protein [Pseudactinotalea sp. HY160]